MDALVAEGRQKLFSGFYNPIGQLTPKNLGKNDLSPEQTRWENRKDLLSTKVNTK